MRRDSIKVLRRGGRIRLRSAGSQFPEERAQAKWHWVPYRKLKGLLPHLVGLLVLTVLALTGYTHGVLRTSAGDVSSMGDDSTLHQVNAVVARRGSTKAAQSMPPPAHNSKVGKRLSHPAARVISPSAAHYPRDETPNEVMLQTAVVLTNVQTSCRLREVMKKLHTDYPNIPIMIEKSNITTSFCKAVTSQHITCYSSSCRWRGCISYRFIYNILHRHPDVRYYLMWDVQFDYMHPHTLLHLAKHYINNNVQIASPCIKDVCNLTTGALHKPAGGGKLTAIPGAQMSNLSQAGCFGSELFSPVFFTSRQTLSQLSWDENAIGCQHADFLLHVREKRLTAAVCPDIQITHRTTCSDSKGKTTPFSDNWLYLSAQMFRKWNLTHVHNGLGRVYRSASDKVTYLDLQWTRVDNSLVADSTSIDYVLHNAVVDHINDRSAGWDYIRPVKGKETDLDYMHTSSCVTRVKGQLNVEYDRRGSFQNKQFVLKVDVNRYDRSCSLFKDYWSVLGSGRLEKKHVYYVSAVSNDTIHMGRLLQMIDSQSDFAHTHLVIVDMSRLGDEQFNLSTFNTRATVHYVYLGSPFSRSIGLKKGFDHAMREARLRGHDDPILFSVDTSMVVPGDFTERIWRSTRCGVSAYAPICYKEKWEGGFWVNFGYGMVGVCASDYMKSNGWDEKWGYHWGAEDVDFIHRLQDNLPYIVRIKEPQYKHSRSEESRITSKYYYTIKNIYPGQLPITPITKLVTDQTLTDSLYRYASSHLSMKGLQFSTVYQTSMTSGHLYDLRLGSSDVQFYVLIRSI